MENNSMIGVDKYFLQMASLVGERSTCRRRKVGCVLVDSSNHVVATGYNGVPTHFEHCIDSPCEGASYSSGEGLEKCLAVHAEQNALCDCAKRGVSCDGATAYITHYPCIICTRLMLAAGIREIKYLYDYKNDELVEVFTKQLCIPVKKLKSDSNEK